MKNTFLILTLFVLSTSSIRLSWNDIQNAAGWGSGYTQSTTWADNSNNSSTSDYTLVQNSASINGSGAQDLLAMYLKQLIILLSNIDNEMRVVRLEVDCTGENYKVLIRIMDPNGNKIYIGMMVHACGNELQIMKFFQSNNVSDIINSFGFIDGTLYNYPDGNIGNNCSNSILDMLGDFCSAIGGSGFNNGNNSSNGNSQHILQPLDDSFNGSGGSGGSGGSFNNSGGSFNGSGGSFNGSTMTTDSHGIKLNIKIPGSENPTGKTILLGSSRPN